MTPTPLAQPAPPPWKLLSAIGVVLLSWASAFIAIRAVASVFSPGPLALGRLVVGSIALGLLTFRRRIQFPRGRTLLLVIGYGLLWFAGYSWTLNAAEHHLDAGTAAMVVNVAPLLVALAAGALLSEGFPRPLLIGIGIAFVGIVVISVGGTGGHSDGFGLLLGIVTAVLYAAGVLLQKVALRSIDAVSATLIGCLAGLVVLLPFLPQAVREVGAAPGSAVLALVYLGAVPTALAFTLWAFALTHTDAGRLTSTTLMVPALAVLLSWIFLGEAPTVAAMLGGALCLIGVAVSRRRAAAGGSGNRDVR